MNSRFDFNPKANLKKEKIEESYSIAPPSYIKIVGKKKKKKKPMKKEVKRQHLTTADFVII